MMKLLISDLDRNYEYELIKDEILIGRVAECDVQLNGQSISRKHARIFKEGPFYFVEDLNSTNGTILNGIKISEKSSLMHKDELMIGQSRLEFFDDEGAMLDDAADLMVSNFRGAGPVAPAEINPNRSIDEIIIFSMKIREKVDSLNSKIPDSSPATHALKLALDGVSGDFDELNGKFNSLKKDIKNYLQRVQTNAVPLLNQKTARNIEELSANPDHPANSQNSGNAGMNSDYLSVLDEVRNKISEIEDYKKSSVFALSVAMKILDMNRGFIVIKDPMIGSIVPFVAKIKNAEISEGAPSMIVAKYVVNNQEIVLCDDPMLDERFMSMSESIVSGTIKSVICVPLIRKGLSLGAIYLDNTEHKKSFGAGDREFIISLADIACGALENAGIFKEMLDEYEDIDAHNKRVEEYLSRLDIISERLILEGVLRESDIEKLRELIIKSAKSPILCIIDEKMASFNSVEKFIEYYKIKRVEADSIKVGQAMLASIPKDYAFARCLVPFEKTLNKTMSVAMADPLDNYTIKELEKATGCEIEPYLCEKERILEILKRVFRQ